MARAGVRDRLSYDALDVTPRNYDWSKGYGETWEYYAADTCEGQDERHKPVLVTNGDPECRTCKSDLSDRFEGPMMNYFYQLPHYRGDATEAAKLLQHLPLALVNFLEPDDDDDTWVLALTGGGMDLTWEICAAYVALGYIPPRHFRKPPKMAGDTLTAGRRRVLAAIEKGIQADVQRAQWARKDLRDLRAYLRENSNRRRGGGGTGVVVG